VAANFGGFDNGIRCDIDGAVASGSAHNLIGVDTQLSGITSGTSGNLIGTAASPINPMLGALQDNGGPTQTMALLPGSPAIDAGDNSLIPSGVTSDQRGNPRIVNATVDIGSFEAQQEITATTVAGSTSTSVFGQSVTFTATVTPPAGSAVPVASGSIQFQVDGNNFGAPVTLVNGSATSAATSSLSVGGHTISAIYTGATTDFMTSTGSLTQTVNKGSTTTVATASPSFASVGQTVTFTSNVSVNSPGSGTPSGTVDFFDTSTSTDLTPGGVALVSGTAAYTTTSLLSGPHAIKVTYSGDGDFLASSGNTGTVTIGPSIWVLDPSASGALSLSGNASINLPGPIYVDSTSSSALSASGNAQLTGALIAVAGGFKKTGNAIISPAPTTGVSAADPLSALAAPNPAGLTNYGSVSFTNGSHTINPGIYSQIKVSGNASVTMSAGSGGTPGIYIIEGGGLTVTGNASLGGQNVFIYNTGSNYPNSGGNFGGITLSGSGTFSLTAPTSGLYAGVAIFQSRANTRALSFSGNAMSGISGIIYAPSALLSFSGNSQLQSALDVGMLNLSGNVALTQTAAGSDGSGDTSGIANTLLAGDLSVYINDPSSLFTADELSRIQDAVNGWNAILAPYNVTITEVSDPALANMVIDTSTTSACGGMVNGVLGCFNAANTEITMVQGWNWYAGADPTQIGTSQYDFETTVLHELGHALGLGGSNDPHSPMYETLPSGVTDRTVTVADLNIPDPPLGADPQMAAGFSVVPPVMSYGGDAAAHAPAAASSVTTIGLVPLTLTQDGGIQKPTPTGQQWAEFVGASAEAAAEPTLVIQGTARISDRTTVFWYESGDDMPLPDGIARAIVRSLDPSAISERPVNSAGVGRAYEPSSMSETVPPHLAVDTALEALVSKWMPQHVTRGRPTGTGGLGDPSLPSKQGAQTPSGTQPVQHAVGYRFTPEIPAEMSTLPFAESRVRAFSSPAHATDILFKAGLIGIGASVLAAKTLKGERTDGKRRLFTFGRDSRDSR
jgi:hypothetical protein